MIHLLVLKQIDKTMHNLDNIDTITEFDLHLSECSVVPIDNGSENPFSFGNFSVTDALGKPREGSTVFVSLNDLLLDHGHLTTCTVLKVI